MCNCTTTVNEYMVKEKNCRLGTTLNFTTGLSRVALVVESIPGQKKPKYHVLPSYCPFCGEKYPEN